jgi:hypothetical protein
MKTSFQHFKTKKKKKKDNKFIVFKLQNSEDEFSYAAKMAFCHRLLKWQ